MALSSMLPLYVGGMQQRLPMGNYKWEDLPVAPEKWMDVRLCHIIQISDFTGIEICRNSFWQKFLRLLLEKNESLCRTWPSSNHITTCFTVWRKLFVGNILQKTPKRRKMPGPTLTKTSSDCSWMHVLARNWRIWESLDKPSFCLLRWWPRCAHSKPIFELPN